VPLYACERCGFTSAAFRADAAAAHRLEYPSCGGVIRIIFQSEDRYRGETHTPQETGLQATAPESRGTQSHATEAGRAFTMDEHIEVDETLRLTLLGELDIGSADTLTARLAELKTDQRPVRLDLSKLVFIDSAGIQAVLVALTDARWHGWHLEVAREVSPTIERAAQIVGIAQVLWPEEPGPRQRSAPPATPPTTA
jgi:anti-anti-sigma factor